jgi:hypothetical protein
MSQNKIGSEYLGNMKSGNAKSQLEKVFEEYKNLLKDKTHPDNQTGAYHKNIQGTINRVLSAAYDLDQQNPGEGLFAIFALILASNLKLKDKVVEQEVEINRLKNANKIK